METTSDFNYFYWFKMNVISKYERNIELIWQLEVGATCILMCELFLLMCQQLLNDVPLVHIDVPAV